MTAPVRIGVIGTGFGKRVVAAVFATTEGCEVVDVVSPRDDAGVQALCARPDVDLISVHSPPFMHAAHVRAALGAGHHVLCDKPFASDATEAAALAAEAEAAGVVHLMNFEFRCDPVRERLRALVHDGAIGDLEHAQWFNLSSGSRVPLRKYGWLFDRSRGGGWVGAWGSHAVDAVRWILGEVVDARAVLFTTVRERPDGEGVLQRCDAEDGFTAWLQVEDGIDVVMDTGFASVANTASRIVVAGSEGVIEDTADERLVVRRADGSKEEFVRPPIEGDRHLEPMQRWAVKVRDAVREGVAAPGMPTFADGLACDLVLDRLRAGVRPGD